MAHARKAVRLVGINRIGQTNRDKIDNTLIIPSESVELIFKSDGACTDESGVGAVELRVVLNRPGAFKYRMCEEYVLTMRRNFKTNEKFFEDLKMEPSHEKSPTASAGPAVADKLRGVGDDGV